MKKSWIFWNIIAFVITIVFIGYNIIEVYNEYVLHLRIEYLYLHDSYLNDIKNRIEIIRGSGISYPPIPNPDLSVIKFIIDILLLNNISMILIFLLIILAHSFIIFISMMINNEEKFKITKYFFIFSNPIIYYIIPIFYVIYYIYKYSYKLVLKLNHYLDR